MRLSKTLVRGLSITVLIMSSLLLAVACEEEPTPELSPTAAPTATPVPTPAPTVGELLSAVGAGIANMSSARFSMVDETGTGSLFFGMAFKSIEAEVEVPDSVKMVVEMETPTFGLLEIEIIRVGGLAFLKLSEDAP